MFVIVPKNNIYIIEHFGIFLKESNPGLRFFFPFISKIKKKINMENKILTLNKEDIITSDNYIFMVDIIINYQIQNALLNFSKMDSDFYFLSHKIISFFRNYIEKNKIKKEDIFLIESKMIEEVLKISSEEAKKVGIEIKTIEIKNMKFQN